MANRPNPFESDYPLNMDYGSNRTTKVMMALITVYNRDGRVSIRSVMNQCGLTLSVTYRQIQRLRAMGLVAYEDNRGGTLRPVPGLIMVGPL